MDKRTLASINLNAVLRGLIPLCENDPKAREIIKDADISVSFEIPGVPSRTFIFDHGTVRTEAPAGKADLRLAFVSPGHFNSMIDGKGIPIPKWGAHKMGFLLGAFTKVTDRLSYIMQTPEGVTLTPEEEELKTILTANIAFAALAEVANIDPTGQKLAHGMRDGALVVEVPSDNFEVACEIKNHKLNFLPQGKPANPTAWMSFHDMEVFRSVLDGEADTYALIGEDKLILSGVIMNIDAANKMLDIVSRYLL